MMNSPHLKVIDTGYQNIMVETVEILLEAGARPNMPDIHKASGPLDILLAPLYFYQSAAPPGYLVPVYVKNLLLLRELPYACAVNSYFKLVAELTRLLLIRRADPSRSQLYRIAMSVASDVVKIRENLDQEPDNLDPYDEIIDSCGNIFRYLMLAGADRFSDEYWDKISYDIDHVSSFVCIAGYSLSSGRSKKLTNMILSALDATNINELRLQVHRFQLVMKGYNPENVSYYIDSAMKWIQCVQLPLSLQDLASRAINRAMSSRSLLDIGASSLDIPCHLKPYILLQSFDKPIGRREKGKIRSHVEKKGDIQLLVKFLDELF